jgi:hypothetical protein
LALAEKQPAPHPPTAALERSQRQWVRQRRVVGKFPRKRLLQVLALSRDSSKPLSGALLGSAISLGGFIGDGRKDGFVQRFPLGGEVLILTNELCQAITAYGLCTIGDISSAAK